MSSTSPIGFDPEKSAKTHPPSSSADPALTKHKKIETSKKSDTKKIAKNALPIEEDPSSGKTKKLARSVSEIEKGKQEDAIGHIARRLNPPKKEKIESEERIQTTEINLHKTNLDENLEVIREEAEEEFEKERLGEEDFAEFKKPEPLSVKTPSKFVYVPSKLEVTGSLEPKTTRFCITGFHDEEFTFEIEYAAKGKDNKPQLEVMLPQILDLINPETNKLDTEEVMLVSFQLSALAKSTRKMLSNFEIENLMDLYHNLKKLSATTFAHGPSEIVVHLNKTIEKLMLYFIIENIKID